MKANALAGKADRHTHLQKARGEGLNQDCKLAYIYLIKHFGFQMLLYINGTFLVCKLRLKLKANIMPGPFASEQFLGKNCYEIIYCCFDSNDGHLKKKKSIKLLYNCLFFIRIYFIKMIQSFKMKRVYEIK